MWCVVLFYLPLQHVKRILLQHLSLAACPPATYWHSLASKLTCLGLWPASGVSCVYLPRIGQKWQAFCQVCTYLERLTGDLEASAHPALDALTAQVLHLDNILYRGKKVQMTAPRCLRINISSRLQCNASVSTLCK